ASLFGLAPRRVYLATACHHRCWWALTLSRNRPHRFTHHLCSPSTGWRQRSLPPPPHQPVEVEPSAGLFSVAPVVGSPRLAVNQAAALWCSAISRPQLFPSPGPLPSPRIP